MNTIRNFYAVLALAIFASSPSFAQTPPAATYLDRGQATFENGLAKIKESDQARRNVLAKQYLQKLTGLAANYKSSGNLDPLIAVRTEKQRFTDEKDVAGTAPAEFPPLLARLYDGYSKLFEEQQQTYSKDITSFVGKYDLSLKNLQAKYTKVDLIEDALLVKEKRAEIAALPFIMDARALVETTESQQRDLQRQRAQMREDQTVAPAAPGDVPNIFKGSDKKRIGDRYDEFIDTLMDEDYEGAAKLVDPDKIEKTGTAVVAAALKSFGPGLQVLKKLGAKFRTGKISIADNGKEAVQIPVLNGPSDNKDADPVNWTKVRGEWYLQL